VRRVIKYGGTSLATPEHYEMAAKTIASLVDMGEQIAVVVSAMGDETSELLDNLVKACAGKAEYKTQVEFVSIGEEKSTLMMTAALKAQKINAIPFYPHKSETWPIIADSDDTSPIAIAKVNEERDFTLRTQKTSNRFNKHVLPLLRVGHVPVISGFLALNSNDELMAFGRGGSDITAFIVGRYIDADEVVIITDVEGVMSSDPKLIENPIVHDELTVEDAEGIAGSGGRIIHPRALKFKTSEMKVRILDYKKQAELARAGTTILGQSQATIFKNDTPLAMLTIMGADWTNKVGVLGRLTSILAKENIPINSASASSKFICFYLDEEYSEKAHRILHKEIEKEKRVVEREERKEKGLSGGGRL